ncbi:MAG: MBL fold metallo-hydrolase [Planctomycetes bacterium]|nr:MBL fold metallo-hydrolase [Planctomycetota bacterium]MBI3844374.1 MBL fold metallo-hydrolase [Planctomycetota bacterium]
MIFETFNVAGLGCNSYMVGSDGEVVVVDPQRDIDVYLKAAERLHVRIIAVVETHLHADHVSGGRDLAAATGASLHVHEAAHAAYPHRAMRDGDMMRAGSMSFKVIHTPGHTPESVCLLVESRELSAPRLLSGDTLFVGDVGRPDLTGNEAARGLASMLYKSLFEKVVKLRDDVVVYPGHGEGSLCGSRSIGGGATTTIGQERRVNHAMQPSSESAFVDRIIAGLPEPPADFHRIKQTNRSGPAPLRSIEPRALTGAEAREAVTKGAVVLDARPKPATFAAGHVAGSVWVCPEGPFATRAAWFTPRGTPIVLVVDSDAAARNAARALCRVGVDEVLGWIQGGVDAWRAAGGEVATVAEVSPATIASKSLRVIDVRETHEWQAGHVDGATHVPLGRLAERLSEIDRKTPLAVMCASGNRSITAVSFLRAKGITNVQNAIGGFVAWKESQKPVSMANK